jgi:HSF-type DNA-binding
MEDSVVDTCMRETLVDRSSSGTPESAKQSTDRDNHNSPLMKLVDAALGPTSVAAVEDVASSGNEVMKAEETNSTGIATSVVSSDNDPPAQVEDDTKVIRGTIHDLVSRQEKKLTFAEFLMQCLNDEANDDVLRWMPCGTQFTITNHRKFTMERMPQLFKIRNMSSFVRKLTRWGFSRVHEKATGNSDIFKHPHFQRDKPELCKRIRCVNRSAMDDGKTMATPMDMRLGPSVLMGNFSESSNRLPGLDFEHDMSLRLSSPRRSIGQSAAHFHGRSPMESNRYHLNQTPRDQHLTCLLEYHLNQTAK